MSIATEVLCGWFGLTVYIKKVTCTNYVQLLFQRDYERYAIADICVIGEGSVIFFLANNAIILNVCVCVAKSLVQY